MKFLVITQKVDADDRNLGFFVRWIETLSEKAEVTVIANEVNEDTVMRLSRGVRVYSLGKEKGASRIRRFFRYQRFLIANLSSADGVFFHMCPEYVLAAHILPKWFGVKTILWYMHKEVSARLRFATLLVDRIFTASRESCRLSSKKIEIVGHGIDADLFGGEKRNISALHLVTAGRVSPVKELRTLILGFLELRKKFPSATFSIVGDPITDADRVYREELLLEFPDTRFNGGVSYSSLPEVYADATVFVHSSRTGSMDKAVLEALASGLPVFTSSEAFSEEMGVKKFKEGDSADLALKIEVAYQKGELGYNERGKSFVREHHYIKSLIQKIIAVYVPSSTI